MRPIPLVFAASLLLGGCGPLQPDAQTTARELPLFLGMRELIAIAEGDGAYVPNNSGAQGAGHIIPMRAVVTPPGQQIFFESPPFAAAPATNTLAGPRLNLLPGLAEGRFTPYVTIESWENDFGPIWTQPLYRFGERDENGEVRILTKGNTVFGMDANHRFYSPFWRVQIVILKTAEEKAKLGTPEQPNTVKEVLDGGWEIVDGGLALCPIVPKDLQLDPALTEGAAGERPAWQGVWGRTVAAEYTAEGAKRMRRLVTSPEGAWAEGRRVTGLRFADRGPPLFRELPGAIVDSAPIFMWVDRLANRTPQPLGLPNVGGHAPLFSGLPLEVPGGITNNGALWDVILVVRPEGAAPFFPGNAEWKELRTVMAARLGTSLDTSPEVDALPNVERYAGRMALNPACFKADSYPATAEGARAWAASCRFLDSQGAIERAVERDDFIDAKKRVLCPFMIWTDEVNP